MLPGPDRRLIVAGAAVTGRAAEVLVLPVVALVLPSMISATPSTVLVLLPSVLLLFLLLLLRLLLQLLLCLLLCLLQFLLLLLCLLLRLLLLLLQRLLLLLRLLLCLLQRLLLCLISVLFLGLIELVLEGGGLVFSILNLLLDVLGLFLGLGLRRKLSLGGEAHHASPPILEFRVIRVDSRCHAQGAGLIISPGDERRAVL